MNTLNDFIRRSITGTVGLLNALVGVVIMLAAAGLLRPIDARWSGLSFGFDPAGLPFLSVLGWVLLGTVVFVSGVFFVLLAFRRAKKGPAPASTAAAPGQVSISTQSLESLVQLVGERLAGVRTLVPHLVMKKDEWHAEADVLLQPGVGKDLQSAIRDQLRTAIERHTGRSVAKLDLRFSEAPPVEQSAAQTAAPA